MTIDFQPEQKQLSSIDFNKESSAPSVLQQLLHGAVQGNINALKGLPQYLVPISKPIVEAAQEIESKISPSIKEGPYYKTARFGTEWGPSVYDVGALGYGLGGLALKGLGKVIAPVIGKNAKETATNFINHLMGNTSFTKAHVPIANEVRKDSRAARDLSKDNYENLKSEALNRGYQNIVKKPIPGISITPSESKYIDLNLFKNHIDEIKPTSIRLKNLIDEIRTNPSFKSAHELQSELGKEGAYLTSSSDGALRLEGGKLYGARDALKNDIINSFEKNNDRDLANKYEEATQYHLNNVIPYLENAVTRKIALRKGIKEINPTSIINTLKKNESASVNAINRKLSQKSKNIILAQGLKGAARTVKGRLKVDPNKLLDLYERLDQKGLEEFRTPESEYAINKIANQLQRAKYLRRGIGAGAAVGAYFGLPQFIEKVL